MVWQRWSDEDKETLRNNYRRIETSKLAAILGRSTKQIREAAKRFCKCRKQCRFADYKDRLLALHTDGLSSWAIAQELKVSQTTVEFWLKRQGLHGNGWSPESTVRRRQTKMTGWLTDNHVLVWWALRKRFGAVPQDIEVIPGWTVEDVYHDCIIHLMRKAHQYNRDKAKRSTWAVMVTRYRIMRLEFRAGRLHRRECLVGDVYKLDKHKHDRRIRNRRSDTNNEFTESVRERLHECLAQLPDEDRELLLAASQGSDNLENTGPKRAALEKLRAVYFALET